MTPRLVAHVEVTALIRRIEARGGHGMVIARGDREAGTILLLLADRGHPETVLERWLDIDGDYRWRRAGPQATENKDNITGYLDRRRQSDTDLWIVELDVAGAERFAAEMIADG